MAERHAVSRRGFLRTAATAGAGGLVAAAAAPARPREPATFVLVHGANGNAAASAPVVAGLALAGHRALAVDLPGHGPAANFPASYQAPQDLQAFATAPSPTLATSSLQSNVDHVADVVRRAALAGPVILVGHSMGGATITRVANEVPELIDRLVYLTAFCCTALGSVLDCFMTPEAATSQLAAIPSVGDPERIGVSRTNWRSAEPEFLATVKAALAGGYSDEGFMAALNLFEPDESNLVAVDDARGDPASWGRVPRTYVRCTADRAIPVALQDRMIAEADAVTPCNTFEVHDLDAPHLGPEDPGELVDLLTKLSRCDRTF